jgi:4'-phosphopantetheinyl transferase
MQIGPIERWSAPPEHLDLSANELHVWNAFLEPERYSLSSLQRTLSGDEMDRAEQYRFAADRHRFIAARGLLRIVLGRYLGISPETLRFRYGPYGKPSVAVESGGTSLQFSVSHSSSLVLYAVTRGRQVGIDVERIRLLPEAQALVERYFSSAEQVAFCALPSEQQLLAFFRCWTRKEAYIKAKGQGLSLGLDRFVVSLAPGEPARLLHVDEDQQEASCWSLHELSPGPGYVATLAVEGQGLRLSRYRLPRYTVRHPCGVSMMPCERRNSSWR